MGLLLVLSFQTTMAAGDSVAYQMILSDPVKPDSAYLPYTVVLSFDEYGFTDKYKLSLFIEVCLQKICKPLAVTLFWNALGEYEYLEYPEHLPFTKYDHKLFTPVDYRRLDAILRNRSSILGKHPISFFEKQFTRNPARVDAVTSATPQAIRDAVVEDAAYTSWALWHWVNGEIAGLLLENTLGFCNNDYLLFCLDSEDPRFVRFGLNQIAQKNQVDPSFREKCFHILEHSGGDICKLALQVVTTAPDDTIRMHRELVRRIGMNAGSSQLIIGYFENLKVVAPVIWEDLAGRLRHVSSYYDILTSLMLLEKRAGDSELVRARVAVLIESDDLNISRRAEEFLERKNKANKL
jgi:hypothetical protein